MEDKITTLQTLSSKIDPKLAEFAGKCLEFYKTAGIVSEKAGDKTANSADFGDFNNHLSNYQDNAYKLPPALKNQGQALGSLASVFAYASIPAGKPRQDHLAEIKDSCDVYLSNLVNNAKSDDEKKLFREWRLAVLAIVVYIEQKTKGQVSSGAAAPESAGGANSLFASINQGTGLTKNLKKVDDSQKTHKNPELRGHGVSAKSNTSNSTKSTGVGSFEMGDPIFEESGDFYNGKYLVNVEKVVKGPARTKAIISMCKSTKIIVESKINSVFLENCHDCAVQLKAGMIGTVEVVRCTSCHIQCDITIPFVQFDSSSNCGVYVKETDLMDKERSSEGFSNMQIITSQCDAINVNHMDDKMIHESEHPIPSIFCSKFDQTTKKWIIGPQKV